MGRHVESSRSTRALPPEANVSCSSWRPKDFCLDGREIPRIEASDVRPLSPDLDLWDCWPLTDLNGRTVVHGGRTWWFFLSAPRFNDPALRHGHARIRLLAQSADGWEDHGNAVPDGLNPGSREWAGSAVLDANGTDIRLYFTATGERGEQSISFSQRLFAMPGHLTTSGPGEWREPAELITADGNVYQPAVDKVERGPGMLKAFRDPFFFYDPQTGKNHIVFTASAGWSSDPHNGMVGLATLQPSGWQLDHPLVDAIGVNNELERAQVHFRDGQYYLLWSTQRHTFAPGISGPNGIYGMVAKSLSGPWHPVNGCGLIAANPAEEPTQAYSWIMNGENEVMSFVDFWGQTGLSEPDTVTSKRSHFGGTLAPIFRLKFSGRNVVIVNSP